MYLISIIKYERSNQIIKHCIDRKISRHAKHKGYTHIDETTSLTPLSILHCYLYTMPNSNCNNHNKNNLVVVLVMVVASDTQCMLSTAVYFENRRENTGLQICKD